MSTLRNASLRASRAFTLIELIGVMAVLAILASVAAPRTLKAIDHAVVDAERKNLSQVGEHLKRYLRTYGAVPAAPTSYPTPPAVPVWCTELARLADLNPQELYTNRRQMRRVYLLEPVTAPNPTPRAMIISSMRSGVAVPTGAVNATTFAAIWDTPADKVPPGFTAWSDVAGQGNSVEYLVIERVNLAPDNQTYSVALKNTSSGATASTGTYRVFNPANAQVATGSLAAGAMVPLALRTGYRCELYTATAPTTANYIYVVSNLGRTLEYDGTSWKAL